MQQGDLHTSSTDEYGTLDLHAFVRRAIQFVVVIGTGCEDGDFAVVTATFPDGYELTEKFDGGVYNLYPVAEARAFVAEVIEPTPRAIYGSPEWEAEAEGDLIRAEEEAMR